MKRAMLSLGAALALTLPWAFLGVPTASAVPVTSWDYTASAAFTAFAPIPSVVGTPPGDGTPPGATTRLQWGGDTGFGQSALEILEPNPISGTVLTGGPSVLDITIVHQNRPISGTDLTTLASATITGSLTLTPVLPSPPFPGLPFSLPPLPFSIAFQETPNAEPCTAPSPLGNPCNDIFVLTSPGFPLAFPFLFDGENYLVTLTVAGLGALPAATCFEATGVLSPCFGLTTPENADSPIEVRLAIALVPVPEPSTILLLGSGLAALTLCARRKVSKKIKETA